MLISTFIWSGALGLIRRTDAPSTAPQRMEVISQFSANNTSMWILRDRETGEEYMCSYSGGMVHLVKPSTTPKP